MRIARYIIITCMCICAGLTVQAQNATSSPYSRFGYGELNDNVPGAYRGMGGVGIGMRSKTVINPAQPASYSVVDSTTFMFDLAASAMWSNYQDAMGERNKANGNLEYLTIQFPLWKYIGFSVGLMPYSMVGYDIADSITAVPHPYTSSYIGNGGISEVYAGLSFNIMNWVAIGANIYYMFGKVENTRTLAFSESSINSTSQTKTMQISDVRFRYGVQLFHTFADKHSFVLGGTFENKSKLNGRFTQIETITADTVANTTTGFDLPMTYGVGLSYNYAGRLTLAADYEQTAWNKVRYFDEVGTLKSRARISYGAEYCHNPYGRKYIERMIFRLGSSLSDSYIPQINSKDFTVTLGIGFPLRNVATVINTTFEYGHRGTRSTLEENYLRFTLNASISENWFFKRKL